MKTLTLRLSDSDHAKLSSVATSERIPMANLLMRLFDQYAKSLEPQQRVYTHINKRDKAMADYAELCAALPKTPTYQQATAARESIMALRVDGGNIPHTEMPLPQSVVDVINRTVDKAGVGAALTHREPETMEDLEAMFKEFSDEET